MLHFLLYSLIFGFFFGLHLLIVPYIWCSLFGKPDTRYFRWLDKKFNLKKEYFRLQIFK
jgi:hypothetical protein